MTAKLEKVLYTAKTHTTGGRDGRAVSDDGLLDVQLNPPKSLGGNGSATNPAGVWSARRTGHQLARDGTWICGTSGQRRSSGVPLLQCDPWKHRRCVVGCLIGRMRPGIHFHVEHR